MAQYSVTSTKSYMQAMAPMVEALNALRVSELPKPPKVDTESSPQVSVESTINLFADVTTEKLSLVSDCSVKT
ncbi:hypothetical protein OXX59_010208, partial [Metschnikowia pulcherrima]